MNTYNVEEMFGKELTYKGKKYTVNGYLIGQGKYGVNSLLLTLKLVKGTSSTTYHIPTTLFESGEASTKDEALMEFVNKCNKDYHIVYKELEAKELQRKLQEEQERKQRIFEEAERQKQYLENQKILGAQKGKEDARAKVSTLYKIFTSHTYSCICKASQYTIQFRNAYTIAYEDEKRIMKQERLIQTRANQDTLDEYPGDLDELILWMRKNLLRIDVFASPDKLENEQSAIDVINERDGTDYQVKIRQGQYVAYEAFFKNPATAPKEFLSWIVSKHDYTTSDLSKRVMAHPMNVETGKMTCNSLVKELVYSDEYRFHVGKNTIVA